MMVMVPAPAWFTVPVIPPGFDVAVYEVIAEPPLEAGAVNATVADVAPVAVTAPIVGAPGKPGVTDADASDKDEPPIWFVVFTLNVYAVPAVSPVTWKVLEPE